MSSTQETAEIARSYFRAWTSGNKAEMERLLDENFVFESAMMTINGRDSLLSSQSWPKDAKTSLAAEAYEGDQGFQMYDATNNGNSVRIAEHLQVRDGKLVHSTVVVDGAAFMAFFGMPG
jgi:SnoaL-like domain